MSSSTIFGLPSEAALTFFGVGMTALVAFFGGRGSAIAQLQNSMNDAFRSLVQTLQTERSALAARVSELEGECRQHKQVEESLRRQLERQGIQVITAYKEISSDTVEIRADDG